jgi:cell wall assembly regulator SMI1
MKTVTELWHELMGAYREIGMADSSAILTLHPPINATEMMALQRTIKGVQWPKEYLELLHFHNGSGQGQYELENFSFVLWHFMTSSRAITTYHSYCEQYQGQDMTGYSTGSIPSGVQKVVWDEKWFPIFYSEGGELICLDFNPAPGGKMGQVIEIHKRGTATHKWNSFIDFFNQTVKTITDDPEGEIFPNAEDEKKMAEKERLAKKAERDKDPEAKKPIWSRWLGN